MSARLQRVLLALDPTGADGFEGVARDALSEITGQVFGLLKSGPQGGVGGISGPTANRLVIGFEGKRYKETSRLEPDEGSEGRRGGNRGVMSCRVRRSPYH